MARYDSTRKIARNKAVVQYRKDNPELSLKEIGEVFNVTAPRIYAILKRDNGRTGACNA